MIVVIPLLIVFNSHLSFKQLFSFSIIVVFGIILLPRVIRYITILFPKYRIYLGTPDFMPGWNLKSTAVWLLIFVALYFFYPYYKHKIFYSRQLVNFSYLAFVFSLLQGGVAIISRVVPYFSIFSIFAVPMLMRVSENCRQKRFIFIVLIFCAFLYHGYQLFVGNSGVVPYAIFNKYI